MRDYGKEEAERQAIEEDAELAKQAYQITDAHHLRVLKFFAICAAECQSFLNDSRGQHEREARGAQVYKDVDNLVPGGLIPVVVGESYYEAMLHQWLKTLISDHQR